MTTSRERTARRAATRAHATLVEDLRRAIDDAGLPAGEVARASGVDSGFLARILAGSVRPSLDTYARLAAPLGLDLATRLYPTSGPSIRDRHQAPMLELLLGTTSPRWQPFTEVGVRRPSRGWIDAALHDPRGHVLVATELQSELRRLEQLVRWHAAKADALPSWDGWAHLGEEPAISRLLGCVAPGRRVASRRSSAASCAPPIRPTRTTQSPPSPATTHGPAPRSCGS